MLSLCSSLAHAQIADRVSVPSPTVMTSRSTYAAGGYPRTLSASPPAAALCSLDASTCGSAGSGAARAPAASVANAAALFGPAAGAPLTLPCGCVAAASCCSVAGLG